MSKRLFFALVLMALALFGLSACSPCDMVAPILLSPADGENADIQPPFVLDWNYLDTCPIDNFEIEIAQDENFSGGTYMYTDSVDGSVTTLTSWYPDSNEEYFWRVRAVDEGVNGPFSTVGSFFTGPFCWSSYLVEPILTSPSFGGIYEYPADSLEWDWPLNNCAPESYLVEISMGGAAFTDTTYNGETGTISTSLGFGSTPPIATQFYWRVSAYSDGAYGPPSTIGMFWTGPACTAASLVQPVAEWPLDDEVVTTDIPYLLWSYPDTSCVPEGQRTLVSDKPDMSSIIFDANSPTIDARAITPGHLADCTEYYWQVAMISEGVEGPPSTPSRFVVDASGTCGCASGATTIPVQTTPGDYEILPDTDAHLSWYNPGGCFPDGAAVQIATVYDFADMNEFTIPGDFVTGYDLKALEPATQYRWKAAYYVEDAGAPVIGDYSGQRSFFTGPECTSLADVTAPVRLSPADGSVVTENYAALQFTPGSPGCIPDEYLLHLHEMADFSDPNQLAEYSSPATTVKTEPLDDCTTYYWSVTAVQDGEYGPESDHGSFSVDVDGTCLPPGVPGTAKSNFFCRAGTFEVFEPLWTIENGQKVLAIARNPQTTYILLNVLDQTTNKPFENEIHCWAWTGHITPGWPELEDDGQHDFEVLKVVIPPEPPVEEEPENVCSVNSSAEECAAFGGKYSRTGECACP
jgi:hypothetical protein